MYMSFILIILNITVSYLPHPSFLSNFLASFQGFPSALWGPVMSSRPYHVGDSGILPSSAWVLCFATQTGDVFSHRVLPSSSGEQPSAMSVACVVLRVEELRNQQLLGEYHTHDARIFIRLPVTSGFSIIHSRRVLLFKFFSKVFSWLT